MPRHLVLVGLPGCGKSAVGHDVRLHRLTRLVVGDSDDSGILDALVL